MNEFPFPPDQNPSLSWWGIYIHLTLLVLAVSPFVGIWWQSKTKATKTDLFIGLAAMISGVVFFIPIIQGVRETSVPFVAGYFIFFLVACFVYVLVTIHRIKKQQNRSAIGVIFFSLVSLGIFIGLLLPAVPSRRVAAERIACRYNLKQVGLGTLIFCESEGHFPVTRVIGESGHASTWRLAVSSYTDSKTLVEQYDFGLPWNEERNNQVARQNPYEFQCVSSPEQIDSQGRFISDYSRIVGEGTLFGSNKKLAPSDIKVGTANVIHAIESSGARIVWTEPRDVEMTEESLGLNLPGKKHGFSKGIGSSYHYGGVNVQFLDGSVRLLANGIDKEVLRSMAKGDKEVMEIWD